MKNDLIVFNDTHLGDGSAADNCGLDHFRSIYSALTQLSVTHDIVANGDICEYLQFDPAVVRSMYPAGFFNLFDLRTPGNHDKTDINTNMCEKVMYRNLCITHGHQIDGSQESGAVRAVLKLWALIEKFIGRKKANQVEEHLLCLSNLHYDQYIRNAAKYAFKNNIKILIIGHTHRAGIFTVRRSNLIVIERYRWPWRRDDTVKHFISPLEYCDRNDSVIVVNTGCCVGGKFEYCEIKNYAGRIDEIAIVQK